MKCPKCGSEDINTIYHEKGERVFGYPKCLSAPKELLKHHCKNCHYEWVTEVIPEENQI